MRDHQETASAGARSHGAARSIAEHVEAVRRLLADSAWAARSPEVVPLERARGRVLAQELTAPSPLPGFDNSQMDGYAVRAADTAGDDGTAALRVAATGAAGHAPAELLPGTAAPIMTGAPIPVGADAVVPIEEARPSSFLAAGQTVGLPAGQVPGRFVRAAGADVERGASVLAAGTVLRPAMVGVLAAFGIHEIAVRPLLRAGILTTGDEVAPPGQPLGPAQIHDANAPLLRAALEAMGVEVVAAAHVIDDDDALRALLRRPPASEAAPDLWVSSGGISEGAFEVVRRVLEDEPGSEFLHVAMQPGGPQGLARAGGVPVVCLPGNPVSSWVSAEVLLRPALAQLGAGARPHRRVIATAAQELQPLPGRSRVVRVRWDGQRAHPVGGYGSHLLVAAARADGLVVLAPGEQTIPSGEPVEVLLLD